MFGHKEKIEELLDNIRKKIQEGATILGRKIDMQDGDAKEGISLLIRAELLIDKALTEEKKLVNNLIITKEKARRLMK